MIPEHYGVLNKIRNLKQGWQQTGGSMGTQGNFLVGKLGMLDYLENRSNAVVKTNLEQVPPAGCQQKIDSRLP